MILGLSAIMESMRDLNATKPEHRSEAYGEVILDFKAATVAEVRSLAQMWDVCNTLTNTAFFV